MNFLILNKWTLLSLASIPLLVLIYFYRQRAKKIYISTLFLLEHISPNLKAGSKRQKFTAPASFWLYLIAFLILAWLIINPMFLQKNKITRLVIILDDSISMQAFRQDAITTATKILHQVQKKSAKLEILIIPSQTSKKNIFNGTEIPSAENALANWHPGSPDHDLYKSVQIAQRLASKTQLAYLITDHENKSNNFTDITTVGIGKKIPNVGIAGYATIEKNGSPHWQVLLRNYTDENREIQYWLNINGKFTKPNKITIRANAWRQLSAPFLINPNSENTKNKTDNDHLHLPANWQKVFFTISEDGFTIDNSIPLIRPQEKFIKIAVHNLNNLNNLNLFSETNSEEQITNSSKNNGEAGDHFADEISREKSNARKFQPLLQKLLQSFPAVIPAQNTNVANVIFAEYDPLMPMDISKIQKNSVIFLSKNASENTATKILRGDFVSENHPLIQDLHWGGFLMLDAIPMPLKTSDVPLLWLNDRNVIFLRTVPSQTENARSFKNLICNFSIANSNALRSSEFAILLYRFFNLIRAEKQAPSVVVRECSESLNLGSYAENSYASKQNSYSALNSEPAYLLKTWSLFSYDKKNNAEEIIYSEKEISKKELTHLRAPTYPAFFEIVNLQNDKIIQRGASNFLDTNEADFRQAQSFKTLHAKKSDTRLLNDVLQKNFASVNDLYYWRWLLAAVLILASLIWVKFSIV